MISSVQSQAIRAFTGWSVPEEMIGSGRYEFTLLKGGLINHSFRLSGPEEMDLLIQQFNQQVFKDPEAVQANYMDLWHFLQEQQNGIRLPEPVMTIQGSSLFKDDQGEYWRAFRFIRDSEMHDVAQSGEEAFVTAQTFGHFTAALNPFDSRRLRVVIPRFHDLAFRYEQFKQALAVGNTVRMAEMSDMINGMTERVYYTSFYQGIIQDPVHFPLRVMHHDAKIANILFQRGTEKVICAVDFDTVMPGYFFSDLGDMIRSMACNLEENDTAFDQLIIREAIYNAIVEGYRSVMDDWLTATEKKFIHHAGLLMIYMQALRFLTDYLENDRYYRIGYAEQNRDRALNQFRLLQQLEQYLREKKDYEPCVPSPK